MCRKCYSASKKTPHKIDLSRTVGLYALGIIVVFLSPPSFALPNATYTCVPVLIVAMFCRGVTRYVLW